ncbi:PREDICTED: AT-hook-containing transcription factor [Elephantulus edwardii]|uniref:AT-hook-containing transcription factor n=1 Tax=Elephantulus edwardii TaxID=28737 RepID=UPI0003F0BD34|nr:PREDICTED: AT-hook-containing transcription factor [Elephantulus edwardii]
MASSGTEVHWAEPGLEKGPQRRRRRWAWAEKKDTDGIGPHAWAEEGPFPSATSPELLEDFRLAQQRLPSLEWDPQAGGQQDSECGASAEEEIETEDVDSPESATATLPLYWFPQQESPSDMTEEEQDESPQEAEDTGESAPRLGFQASLSSEDDRSPSSAALGKGKVRGAVASDNVVSGDKLSENSEFSPSVDLCPARSWSSGTVSLGHPSDSLDSTWEGETDVPQPSSLENSLPQNPSRHTLNPDDRTRGSVAQATPTEFHGSSSPPPQSLPCPESGWRETASFSHPQPREDPWKRTKIPPKPLPSRFTGTLTPLNPQARPAQKDRLPRQRPTLAGRSSSDACKYGRGRLNYPLPDFSKVGPRVRFPKDESYRPPKAKSHSWQPQDPARPLIFKSPAEIVREVLLSSEEALAAKDPPPTHLITTVPQEFQTPEQATKLVHQLQEDYHKLLTKYAEAENTIDQLRLGAKVNLYSDPPQPSHSVHVGTVSQGSKVLSFTIPQPRTAEWQPGPTETSRACEVSGWQSSQQGQSPSSPTSASSPGWPPGSQGVTKDQPSVEQTHTLTSQTSQFLAKVESFESLVSAGHLTPQDQLKGFQGLKAAHAALEEEYLKACRDQHLAEQPASSEGKPGKFDPGRELAAEIFQLGNRLEEFKDRLDWHQQEPERTEPDSTLDSTLALPTPGHLSNLPSPSIQALTPAIRNPYPEPPTTVTDPCSLHVDVDVSSVSGELEGRFQTPLRHKELQMEQDFHGLLKRYISMKSLPEAMMVEEEDEEEEQRHSPGADGLTLPAGKGEATRFTSKQLQRQAERSHGSPLREPVERMVSLKPSSLQKSMPRDRRPPGLGNTKKDPPGPGMPDPPQATKSTVSHQSSMASLAGSGISERLPQKSLRHAAVTHLEEPWMASPETDSGFVGSETSRVSPVTQTPEHRLSYISTPGTSSQSFTASVPQDGASHSQTRVPQASRTATEPNTPKSQGQRHLSSTGNPHQQKAPSFHPERALVGETGPSLEFKGRRRISEQRHPSQALNPSPTSAHAAAPPTPRPTETTPSFLITRTGRDQAIRELQEEVSRLRLQLEDSLHRPSQASLTLPASSSTRPTRARDRLADSSVAGGTHSGSKSTERLSSEPEGAEQAVFTGRRRARSSSVPREVSHLSLTSESEPASPQLFSEKSRTTKDSSRTARDRERGRDSSGRPDRITFRGHYTGQEYHILSPKTGQRDSDTTSCPHCPPVRTQDLDGAATRDPLEPSLVDTPRCPMCHQVVSPSERDSTDPATSGAEKPATRRNAPSSSSPKQRSKQAGSPSRPPPGLWYLAAVPPTPAFAYVSSVPATPYPPATVYYVPQRPTSARVAEEWPPTASSRPTAGRRHSVQLDLAGLEELNRALSRAVQAAKSVRSTTKQMSRSLSADLRQAQGLRGSCLF